MHPILIRIGDFFIGSYGVMAALGILAGVFTAAWRARRAGIDENIILDLGFFGILIGMLGARLTYILVNFPSFLQAPMDYILTRQGFVFAGGMIVGCLAAIYYLRRKGAPVWTVFDCIAPSVPLGHAFGRIGCFLAGCCWGKRCDLPWAVAFPAVSDPKGNPMGFVHQDHLEHGWIPFGAERSLPVHPVQLYEAAALFLFFGVLSWLWRRRRFDGHLVAAYMLMYGAARFGLEFLRGDSSRGALGALSTSQWISLAAMVCGAVIWLWRRTLPMVELPLAKGERRGAETEAGEEPLATPRPRHKRKAPR